MRPRSNVFAQWSLYWLVLLLALALASSVLVILWFAVPAAYAQDEENTSDTNTSNTSDTNTSDTVYEVTPASGSESQETPIAGTDDAENSSERFFVELPSLPAADGTSLQTLRREQENFRREAQQSGVSYEERFAFETLFNGLSIQLDEPYQASELERLSSAKAVYPVLDVPPPKTESVSDPELATALTMTGADIAQSNLGYTGKGVKVGVLDTGIDLDHPDLGGDNNPDKNRDPFPTNRIVAGYDFVGDDFNADETSPTYNPNATPDDYPDDCQGHGTHVAGIVGANGEVKGVAPNVSLGAYRVFGCQGSADSDIIIKAMEQALADDMDVLNISIGTPFQWPQYPTAQAADRLVNKGVSVVASIGNNGANGLYAASAPGIGEKVIGVASYNNTSAPTTGTRGLIASSSSYGLTPDLQLKPDIGAPGGFIRSTYPLEGGTIPPPAVPTGTAKYAILSGTSMASPHVAGAAALLLEASPKTPAQAVRDILQNSADPKNWSLAVPGSPASNVFDHVHRQGAGMLDIDDAILSKTKVEPGKLALGESQAGPAEKTLSIENSSRNEVKYNLSAEGAVHTGPNTTFVPSFFTGGVTTRFKVDGADEAPTVQVTVPPRSKKDVVVKITAAAGLPNRTQYGGYIKLQGGGQTYRVPYAGFKGDYQSIQALTSTATNTYPRLVNQTGQQQDTYTLANGDIPYIRVHLDHPVRRIVWEVKDAESGKSWHRALDTEYRARNTAALGFFALAWDGKIQQGNEEEDEKPQEVPNGTYKITMRVQKAFVKDDQSSLKGPDDDPAYWEQWESPPITIARPS